ncbi:MAG: MarR family transcriptional regulator [Clostridia bacterium]|nr:MarR family transcriptional regulator [Clostridia bacterium]
MPNREDYRRVIGLLHRIDVLRRISIHQGAGGLALRRSQMPMLGFIADHEGCTQADIAKEFRVSAASVACSAKRMEAAGLIERRTDEENQRCNRLRATEEGHAHLHKMRDVFDALDEATFRGFSTEELDTLASLLSRMIENYALGDMAGKPMCELIHRLKEMEERKP